VQHAVVGLVCAGQFPSALLPEVEPPLQAVAAGPEESVVDLSQLLAGPLRGDVLEPELELRHRLLPEQRHLAVDPDPDTGLLAGGAVQWWFPTQPSKGIAHRDRDPVATGITAPTSR
jgi:hypothetical protein